MSRLLVILGLWMLVVLTGCIPGTGSETEEISGLPTPTIHPFFQAGVATPVASETASPSSAAPATDTPVSPTAAPGVITPTLTVVPELQPDISQTQTMTITIYADELSSDWQLLESDTVETNLSDTTRVHNGRSSIAITPSEDFSAQLFVLSEEAERAYPQDRLVAIYFWLNSGDDFLALEDLAFTILGSNDYPYYVAEDESVFIDGEFPFSETPLYYLGLNQAIPPDTWVEVEVLLDNLVFDPVYEYVTGFYIKNDAGYFNTFYVDDISFMMLADEEVSETAVLQTTPPDNTISPAVTQTPSTPVPNEACVVTPPQGWVLYSIVAGDAISNLAVQRGVTEEEVIQVNCLTPGDPLSVDQQIYLPPAVQPATATPTPAS